MLGSKPEISCTRQGKCSTILPSPTRAGKEKVAGHEGSQYFVKGSSLPHSYPSCTSILLCWPMWTLPAVALSVQLNLNEFIYLSNHIGLFTNLYYYSNVGRYIQIAVTLKSSAATLVVGYSSCCPLALDLRLSYF